jgi:hypothetical protein
MVDTLFLLAIGALGWGASLATYRALALRNAWPMGALQTERPSVPFVVGLAALAVGLMFAAARGTMQGGWVIIVFGLAFATFWSGFLRVGAQSALLLAPVAAGVLLLGWIGSVFG